MLNACLDVGLSCYFRTGDRSDANCHSECFIYFMNKFVLIFRGNIIIYRSVLSSAAVYTSINGNKPSSPTGSDEAGIAWTYPSGHMTL